MLLLMSILSVFTQATDGVLTLHTNENPKWSSRAGKRGISFSPGEKKGFFYYIRLNKYIKPQREFYFKMWSRGRVLSAQQNFFNRKLPNYNQPTQIKYKFQVKL